MNTVYNTESLSNRLFELAAKADDKSKADGQLLQFLQWLYDNDFLRNLTQFDYECLMDEDFDYLSLPILRNHKIAIGIDIWDGFCRIGIDPSECFNKTNQCSIIARFPLSKREEKRFYNTLEKLLDKKTDYSKDWFRQASKSWYGSFAKFGEVR